MIFSDEVPDDYTVLLNSYKVLDDGVIQDPYGPDFTDPEILAAAGYEEAAQSLGLRHAEEHGVWYLND